MVVNGLCIVSYRLYFRFDGRLIVNQVGRSVNALGMGHLMAVLHYFYGVFGGRLRKRVRLRLKENAAVFLVY